MEQLSPAVSHDLRHNVGQKLSALIPKVDRSKHLLVDLYKTMLLDWNISYQGTIDIIPVIEAASKAPRIPVSWITGNYIDSLFEEVAECDALKTVFWQNNDELSENYSVISSSDTTLLLSTANELLTAESIKNEMDLINSVLESKTPYSIIGTDSNAAFELLDVAQGKAERA